MFIETEPTIYGNTAGSDITARQVLEAPHGTDWTGKYKFRVLEADTGRGMASWLTLDDLRSLYDHIGALIEDAETGATPDA